MTLIFARFGIYLISNLQAVKHSGVTYFFVLRI